VTASFSSLSISWRDGKGRGAGGIVGVMDGGGMEWEAWEVIDSSAVGSGMQLEISTICVWNSLPASVI